MTASKIVLGAASGAGGGDNLYVENVFSTFLYKGTGANQTITNNIDLSGEGGLVWLKSRSSAESNILTDSERGVTKLLNSNNTTAEASNSDISAFNNNGFSLQYTYGSTNTNNTDYVSWTFRKAPKFFDVQKFTAGYGNTTVSHNLSTSPGMIILKRINSTSDWWVFHRSLGTGNNSMLKLQDTTAELGYRVDTPNNHFLSVSSTSVTLTSLTGAAEYIMYLFAHNNSDGDYGDNADQDIIKCGSFTHSSSTGNTIDLGFEPQWLLVKSATSTIGWYIWDTMRGWTVVDQANLQPNSSGAESTGSNTNAGWPQITNTGFRVGTNSNMGDNKTFIYMAIRRGPMATPETASSVFAIDTKTSSESTAPLLDSSFAVDFAWWRQPVAYSAAFRVGSRLQGTKEFAANSNYRESNSPYMTWDHQNGIGTAGSVSSNGYGWMWARAPGYFDAVAYSGDGQSTHNITHNLGVAPEMIWIKRRGVGAAGNTDWSVYHKDVYGAGGVDGVLKINSSAAQEDLGIFGTPSSTQFTVKTSYSTVNNSSGTYMAYLFATATGVSKVGSYTGNGGSAVQNIDCGFSNGAKLVLIKCATASGDWMVFDTSRGIVVGNDAELKFNNTDTEVSSTDQIDPLSSGFSIPTSADVHMNKNGETFIFYAVAT
jgi:hypothetical protein